MCPIRFWTLQPALPLLLRCWEWSISSAPALGWTKAQWGLSLRWESYHQNPHYILNTAANISGGSRARRSYKTGPSWFHSKPALAVYWAGLYTHSNTTPCLPHHHRTPTHPQGDTNSGPWDKHVIYGSNTKSLLELLAHHYQRTHIQHLFVST